MSNLKSVEIGNCPIQIGDGNYSSKYPKASDFLTSGIPFITASDFRNGRISSESFRYISQEQHNALTKGHIKAGDILIVTRGNGLGKVAWVDPEFENCNINAQLVFLRADGYEIHNRFLYYLLSSELYKNVFDNFSSGSAQPQLPIKSLLKIELILPPISTQRAIAYILGSIDDKIESNHKMNKTLESMARALFKSWFIDFDPVRAKMNGRWKRGQSLQGLPAELFDLFPDNFEQSNGFDVPIGWPLLRFAEMVNILGGGTPKTSRPDYWGGDIPWFSVVDAPSHSDVFVLKTQKTVTQEGIDNSSANILPEGVTIISARGTVGKTAMIGRPMAINQSCYGLEGKDRNPIFTYLATNTLVESLKANSHGSVFDTITRGTFDTINFVSPSSMVLKHFEIAISPIFRRIKSNLEMTLGLEEIRNALLPPLVSGDLEIKNVGRFLKEKGQ